MNRARRRLSEPPGAEPPGGESRRRATRGTSQRAEAVGEHGRREDRRPEPAQAGRPGSMLDGLLGGLLAQSAVTSESPTARSGALVS